MSERFLLAAVSLIFVGVFAFTYLYADRNRRSAPLAAFGADRPLPVDIVDAPREPPGNRAIADIRTPTPSGRPVVAGPAPTFSICHTGGGANCVVDGDTAWIRGEKIRIADIDAPETHPPRCQSEASLGNRATERLAELMNSGPFELRTLDRDIDRYGRKLRVLVRDGRSLGDQLVAEGLARSWEGRRRPWC
ncbi:thermonuclease family protein [Sphingomonas hengshuiensis]|uniref:thermonuclease family protein n=1 Tax=Sphingomonas hengshuiensis TaxID=1609977 RepID=UPI001D123D30|nr:thermonuclease family protein [Sphingomonas hengshuiensis]